MWELGDEASVAAVKRIFELNVKGFGYHKIAKILNQEKRTFARSKPKKIGSSGLGMIDDSQYHHEPHIFRGKNLQSNSQRSVQEN